MQVAARSNDQEAEKVSAEASAVKQARRGLALGKFACRLHVAAVLLCNELVLKIRSYVKLCNMPPMGGLRVLAAVWRMASGYCRVFWAVLQARSSAAGTWVGLRCS